MIAERSWENLDFTDTKIVLVGEAESDARILAEIALAAGYDKPNSIYTGQYDVRADGRYFHGGNTRFVDILSALPSVGGFDGVRDIILAVDSTEDPAAAFASVKRQVQAAKGDAGDGKEYRFTAPSVLHQISTEGTPRIHVMAVPGPLQKGGLETLCIAARVERLGNQGPALLEKADQAANILVGDLGWTTEQIDKLRLRNLLSISQSNVDLRAWECFNGNPAVLSAHAHAFKPIRDFLKDVADGAE